MPDTAWTSRKKSRTGSEEQDPVPADFIAEVRGVRLSSYRVGRTGPGATVRCSDHRTGSEEQDPGLRCFRTGSEEQDPVPRSP